MAPLLASSFEGLNLFLWTCISGTILLAVVAALLAQAKYCKTSLYLALLGLMVSLVILVDTVRYQQYGTAFIATSVTGVGSNLVIVFFAIASLKK